METITLRKSPVEDSQLILIDVDGDTVWAETNKELLKEYILELIDKLLCTKEYPSEKERFLSKIIPDKDSRIRKMVKKYLSKQLNPPEKE